MEIPSVKQWRAKIDGSTPSGRNGKSPMTMLERIELILSIYHDLKHNPVEQELGEKDFCVAYLFFATDIWLRKKNSVPKTGPQSDGVRFHGNAEHGAAVKELNDLCRKIILLTIHRKKELYVLDDPRHFIAELPEHGFGRINFSASNDRKRGSSYRMSPWFTMDEMVRWKLRFRNGLAYRLSDPNDPDCQTFIKYDTTGNEESERRDGFVHFVMNRFGHIISGYDAERMLFFHSTLAGGWGTYTAGVLRAEQGKIVALSPDSGHYQSTKQSLTTVLYRLFLYQVDIRWIELYDISRDFKPRKIDKGAVPETWSLLLRMCTA